MQDSSAEKPQSEKNSGEEDKARPGAGNGAEEPESNQAAADGADSQADSAAAGNSGEDSSQANGAAAEGIDASGEASDAPPTREEFDSLNDKYMRALADAQNIRRRAERDLRESAKFRSSGLARDLLPVHDNLKRALSSIEKDKSDAASSVIEGIELTHREFLKALGRHGVEVISPEAGEPFDSKLHEAMFQAPANDVPAGSIVSVMTEGFMIHDRLLRPAQVGVSSGPPPGQGKVEIETVKE